MRLRACVILPSLLADVFVQAQAQATEAEQAVATIPETMGTLGIKPTC